LTLVGWMAMSQLIAEDAESKFDAAASDIQLIPTNDGKSHPGVLMYLQGAHRAL